MNLRVITLTLTCFILLSCGRSTNHTTAPVQSAYNDGFEVVVVETTDDGTITSAKSLPLKEAESTLKDNPQLGFTISDSDRIAQLLQAETTQQGDFTIQVTATTTNTNQIIRTSFHYSSNTFWYEYRVANGSVTPLSSGFHDLNHNSTVQYIKNTP